MNIGNVLYGTGIYPATPSSTATTTSKIGIGVNAPEATLDVNGTAKVRSLPSGGTYMVTADARGNLYNGGSVGVAKTDVSTVISSIVIAATEIAPYRQSVFIYYGGAVASVSLPTILTTADIGKEVIIVNRTAANLFVSYTTADQLTGSPTAVTFSILTNGGQTFMWVGDMWVILERF
jgi:hypothetical protein